MIYPRSLRLRMMLLFCAVVGVLLAGSYLGIYALVSREIRAQLDRQLLETARPVVADLISDQNEQDVNELDLPDEYFELLDPSGRVLQRSKNLAARPLGLGGAGLALSQPIFRTVNDANRGLLRLALVPFQRGKDSCVLAVATPTRDIDLALGSFRRMVLWLLPLSLLVVGAISAWYVGRSLRPIAELTRQAALMTERIQGSTSEAMDLKESLRLPLATSNPHDELGHLAATFNQLFARVDAALRQLRQFVSDASHELRTPLSVLQGETELLLSETRSAEEYQKALQVIDDELKKLSRIVEGLFTLALADAGELRLATEPFYLNEVLEETCALAAPRARAKNIAIVRDLKQEVAYHGDEAFLRQLFLIFLENAVKYSPVNTCIGVNLETADGVVRARFQDQGIGISSEHLPHIFERFYRAAPAGRDESGEAQSGGLGLAIAQAIARAHGGSIECKSAPGAGSTFTVNLPLGVVASVASTSAVAAAAEFGRRGDAKLADRVRDK